MLEKRANLKFIYLMILVKLIFLFFLGEGFSYVPELVELSVRISELQAINTVLAQKRYNKLGTTDDASAQHFETYHFEQIILKEKCSFVKQPLSGFLFQTPTEIYMAINFKKQGKTVFFNSECKILSEFNNMQIKQIFHDRGMVQTGILYFITEDQQLFHTYEDNQFQNILKLTTLDKKAVVGGIARYRGKDRVQIYVTYIDGTIEVYDESGNSKLRLFLEENRYEVSLLADHHPYPLIATTSNWMSMLDTTKYVEIAQNCPHIPDIKYILSQNYYGQTIYILNSQKIFVVNFQISKKLCTIKREYDLTASISKINKVSYFSNALFIDNKVFNMTSRALFHRTDCSIDSDMEFISKRNQHDKDYCLKRCCRDGECSIVFYEVKRVDKDKSIFIWLTVSFIVVIFVSLSLMKKSSVSNLELEENPPLISQKKLNQISKKNREKNKSKKK